MTGYLCDPVTGEPYNAETFDLDAYLARFDPEWLESSAGRRELTRDDPLLWAVLYVPHLMKNAEGEITFSDVHLGLYRDALAMRTMPGVEGDRRAYVAPRESAKSTTLFVITSLWLACHYPCFISAFSSSAQQSVDHLKAVRREINRNALLRLDYPDTATKPLGPDDAAVADNASIIFSRNGFCFMARGIDTEVLGLVDALNRRPAIIYLDDVERAEGSSGYSPYQAGQRLKSITDTVLPMNTRAHVRLVGTVTIPGGIVHQLVQTVVTREPPAQWIIEERFKVTYFPPIIKRPDGTERSVWPGRWPIEYLQSIRGTRSFRKSFANQPDSVDGGYWSTDDIVVGEVPGVTRRVLFLDPAVTSKRTSDETGIAIVGFSPTAGRCVVEHAEGVRLTGGPLRQHLAHLIKVHPGMVHGLMVETNQGGDLWRETLRVLGLKILTVHSSESKEVRFAEALDLYQKPVPLVVHAREFPVLVAQMTGFPLVAHDDVADAVVTGVLAFLKPTPGRTLRATTESYV
jgi:phage terminase large subunit-like protein